MLPHFQVISVHLGVQAIHPLTLPGDNKAER